MLMYPVYETNFVRFSPMWMHILDPKGMVTLLYCNHSLLNLTWSPAPSSPSSRSTWTPWAISGLWFSIAISKFKVRKSKPFFQNWNKMLNKFKLFFSLKTFTKYCTTTIAKTTKLLIFTKSIILGNFDFLSTWTFSFTLLTQAILNDP